MSAASHGTLILLNGTSSSGKTSTANALQDLLTEPYLETGIDKYIFMLPRRYLVPPLWHDVLGSATHAGAVGNRLVSGMHHAALALLQTGNNVLLDHVLVEKEWVSEAARLFANERAYLVAIDCPLLVLEQRERARGNRTLGQAGAQFPLVHAFGVYDFRVDTSTLDARACAAQIQSHITTQPPRAFQTLTERFQGES